MLRTLASYFLGENAETIENQVDVQLANENDEDWVFVEDLSHQNVNNDNNKEERIPNPIDRLELDPQYEHQLHHDHLNQEYKMQLDECSVFPIDQQQDEERVEEEEDFSWENSLIEHPSVYIASQQQQQQQQTEDKKKKKNKKTRDNIGQSSPNNIPVVAPSSLQLGLPSVPHPASNNHHHHPSAPQSQSQPPQVTTQRTNSRNILHQQPPNVDNVLIAQKQHQSGKNKKQFHRDSQVQHQNGRNNKPARRSDKQTYTRFSRVNNDRNLGKRCQNVNGQKC